MTTTWPPPGPRIRHGWRCTRTGAVVETARQDVLGRGHVVSMCTECDGTDLVDRVRTEREATT